MTEKEKKICQGNIKAIFCPVARKLITFEIAKNR